MGAATVSLPPGGRVLLGASITIAALLMLIVLVLTSLTGVLNGDAQTGEFAPSAAAVADIPPEILPIYLQVGQSSGVDWAILAAIGKIETDHGRSSAKGVHSGVNAYGCCAGPMQFSVIGAGGGTWGAFGVDGDHDGDKDVYDPVDAIPTAAAYLKASGAPDDYNRAIFAYNHASWYVADVLAQAEKYRGAAQDATVPQLPGERANAQEVLRLADGPNPRITLTNYGRNDLQTGQIDARVTSLLVAIASRHTIVVTSLKTGHSYYAASGNPSNHAFGRAADIAKVDGQVCDSTTQDRTGNCWLLARELAQITGPLHPSELIYGIDPDGPSGPAFALPDHTDHVHFGWEGKP